MDSAKPRKSFNITKAKIIMLGDYGVGKTTFLNSQIEEPYRNTSRNENTTISNTFYYIFMTACES